MVRFAIIGTGGMANWHAENFNNIRGCKLAACCDVVPGRAAEFAEKHRIPAAYEDTAEMFEHEKIDAVSIVASDDAHCPAALEAIRRGAHVMCEKPLADNLKNARRMAAAARRKGVLTAVNFSYRDFAASQKAARMVADGKIGRVLHVEGSYLQSWLSSKVWGDWRETPAFLWRLSKRHGSLGCLGDIGVHLFDLTSFVVGEITALSCDLQTFDKGTKRLGEYVLDANDGFTAAVRFRNGAAGVLHASRWATGHANTVALRVYGDKGALDLNLDREEGDRLRACLGPRAADQTKWKPVRCPQTPNMYTRFVTAVRTGRPCQTSFDGGAKVQAYLEYAMLAAEKDGFVKIR